jgi:predicted phosphodiesterase
VSLREDVAVAAERLPSENARADVLAQQVGALKRQVRDQQSTIDTLERVAEYSGRALKPPRWTTARTKKDDKTATLVTILSDCHFDEMVNPAEIDGLNAYNRDIAELRLARYFSQIVRLSRDYLTGMTYDGVVLMLGGDLISGDIHEELQDTNEAQTLDTVLHWSERIAAGVACLADEFGRVHVPVVVGNHGRRSRKPRAKGRARDNFDWLIGQLLARHFDRDPRVTFDITDGTDILVQVHDTRILLTHGDQVGGGQGIGGIWPGVMRMVAKKRVRHQFDTVAMGHFHQLIAAPTASVIVNGSLKGYDEYAAIGNFTPEPPQQALFTVAPGRGFTFAAPVQVSAGRKREGW